jgi:hypothetical protein
MVDQEVLALSYSQDQPDADAKLAFPNHWVGCIQQGLLIHPLPITWITALAMVPR